MKREAVQQITFEQLARGGRTSAEMEPGVIQKGCRGFEMVARRRGRSRFRA